MVITVTLYSRPGCHLCDDMKAVVSRTMQNISTPITIDEVDISTDPELERLYGIEIPVLMVNGKKVAKYRVTEADLRRMLNDRAGGAG
jgi:glutaredoxin